MRLRRRPRGVTTVIVLTVAGVLAAAGTLSHNAMQQPPQPAVSGEELARQWTQTHDGPQPYPDVHIDSDVPITMGDGTVLKADVYRPMREENRPTDESLPTIVTMTPYSKLMTSLVDAAMNLPELQPLAMDLVNRINLSGTPLSGFDELVHALDGGTVSTVLGLDQQLVRSGYNVVSVDVRGTGASHGLWDTLGEREQLDTREVIDWAAEQPWSTGKVAMSGGSYSGINQLRAAENAPESLEAIFPVEPGSDLMRDVVAPGGGVGVTFLPLWLNSVNQAKLVPDMSSMLDGTFDWTWLRDRVADPATNYDLLAQALLTPTMSEAPEELEDALDADSAFRQGILGHPERVDVPAFVYGGWHDIFANSATDMYNKMPLAPGDKQLLVGDTYHANPGSGTGTPGAPPRLDVLQRAWFDHWLKGIDNGVTGHGPVVVREQGGQWVTLEQFPQQGMTHRRVYLSDAASGSTSESLHDGSLTTQPPEQQHELTVAPGLTTLCSRDAAQGSAGITAVIDACAKDSRIAERNALTFTSAPAAEPTTISGPISVHLNTVHDATDGYWNVTVNDVAPEGTSTVLSTGQLTSSMRAVDDANSTRSDHGDLTAPHHPLTTESMLPVSPGEPVELDIGVIPTQAVLQPGHQLRIDVFAGNAPKAVPFRPMLNNSELQAQQLRLDPNAPSFVNLPTDLPLVSIPPPTPAETEPAGVVDPAGEPGPPAPMPEPASSSEPAIGP